ncbi:MAG: hypothetical protein JNM98_17880 [Rhodocyclaceae bacterium]|nr:hypothetical protein [Rhodocyclaceae bacterium]
MQKPQDPSDKPLFEKGRLYQFNGHDFVELEPSQEKKLPVTEEAFEAVKEVRAAAAKAIGMRPELSLCASAMLLAAADVPDIAARVKALGQRVYGSN